MSCRPDLGVPTSILHSSTLHQHARYTRTQKHLLRAMHRLLAVGQVAAFEHCGPFRPAHAARELVISMLQFILCIRQEALHGLLFIATIIALCGHLIPAESKCVAASTHRGERRSTGAWKSTTYHMEACYVQVHVQAV